MGRHRIVGKKLKDSEQIAFRNIGRGWQDGGQAMANGGILVGNLEEKDRIA